MNDREITINDPLADALFVAKPDAIGGLSLTQEQAVAVAGFVYQHFPAPQPEAARVKEDLVDDGSFSAASKPVGHEKI